MRKLLALLVFSSACVVGVPANAITVVDLAPGVNIPTVVPPQSLQLEDFDSVHFSNTFATFTSTGASIVTGLNQGVNAPPFVGPGSGQADPNNYLAVFGGTTETITLKAGSGLVPQSFGLYIGSLDSYNTITFMNGASVVATLTGTDIANDVNANLASVGPPLQTGPPLTNQSGFVANRYVIFSDIGAFTSVVLGSCGLPAGCTNAFEVDNLSFATTTSLAGGVPEASTWIMMILGFLSVGLVGYRRTGLSLRLV
jgi:hypothetical protein